MNQRVDDAKRNSRGMMARCSLTLALLAICLTGCVQGGSPNVSSPTITFSKIPPAGGGGPTTSGVVEGHVSGARKGQRIVVYAWSHTWWVQPGRERPFTEIRSDGSWSAAIHLGTTYAALLVDPNFQPSVTITDLPKPGALIAAVATVDGTAPARNSPQPKLRFSDYDWEIRFSPNSHLGKLHRYLPENLRVDDRGFLHMTIKKEGGEWTCSEVNLNHSFGYGTYRFEVADTAHLEPAAALTMYTRSFSSTAPNHREIDINLSQWGDPTGKNVQYVVQPYYAPRNVFAFSVPAGPAAFSYRWDQDSIAFSTVRKPQAAKGESVASHVFTSGIPVPGDETLFLNFCVANTSKLQLQHDQEVVLEKVLYLP